MKTTPEFLAAALLLASTASTLAEVHYVDVNSTNATLPYTNWATAATNIQDAVDAAVAGDEVVVTNGVYATGERDNEAGTSRVAVDKPLNLRSVNGPQFTFIDGGGFGRRCVYLTNSATLSGFTLTNGVTIDSGISYVNGGGGVWCAASGAVVSNCVISGNQALTFDGDACGGGAYGGTLNNCTLLGNSVHWIGSDFNWYSVLTACGGGAAYCTLNHCTLRNNSAAMPPTPYSDSVFAEGGAAAWCMLNNCTLTGNRAQVSAWSPGDSNGGAVGGGAYQCELQNCTLSRNSAQAPFISWAWPGGSSGGAFGGSLYNCTLVGNSANYDRGGASGGTRNCILFSNPPDVDYYSPGHLVGNDWVGDPLFVDTNGWANLRLQSNSPCINAGNNFYVTNATDLDGNPRIAGGTVDIGAYEFQAPASMISYAWLQQFNLPINPSTDTADPDGDAVDNYHEWLAGTNPTNRFSSPAQLTIVSSGTNIILTWPTNAGGFTLQSTTNLRSPAAWVTNSPTPVVVNGQNTVTDHIAGAQRFYRLKQ